MSAKVLVEAVHVVPGALLDSSVNRSASRGSSGITRDLLGVEVLGQVVPVVVLDIIVSISAIRGSTGSTRGLVGHYCQ